LPYWNSDIGGFFNSAPDDPDYRELFVRWFQFASFTPIFRTHGTGPGKEYWAFGEEAAAIQKDFIRLRYRLLPYLYSVAGAVTHRHASFMQPLLAEFPDDATAREISDEFLVGPSLLVAPVLERGARARRVYLPGGADWVDAWTGGVHRGAQWLDCAAPLARLPLFCRAGSILPMGRVVQRSSDQVHHPLMLLVHPGRDGVFDLYEDAGDGYGYAAGESSLVPVRWDEASRTLSLGERHGSYPGMATTRVIEVVVVAPGHGWPGVTSGEVRRFVYDGRPADIRL
jgi:alpha-D-xyloside xylohydrolase